MITIKSKDEIECMRCAGRVAGQALSAAGNAVKPGITTLELDKVVRKVIAENGMKPSFLGYGGFPGAACISVNEEVIHGIPGSKRIEEGDLVKIDVGAEYKGYHGDTAATFACGKAGDEALKLIEVTRQSFYEGIKFAREGYRISDISHAIQQYCEDRGYSVVRKYVGHGVGAALHEDPEVPNYGQPGHGPRLKAGMTIAIEPMINVGTYGVKVLANEWTVVTLDGALSAHYEHSVLITQGDPVLLTLPE